MGAAEPSLCSTHVMVPSFSLIRDTVSPEVWAHTASEYPTTHERLER